MFPPAFVKRTSASNQGAAQKDRQDFENSVPALPMLTGSYFLSRFFQSSHFLLRVKYVISTTLTITAKYMKQLDKVHVEKRTSKMGSPACYTSRNTTLTRSKSAHRPHFFPKINRTRYGNLSRIKVLYLWVCLYMFVLFLCYLSCTVTKVKIHILGNSRWNFYFSPILAQ